MPKVVASLDHVRRTGEVTRGSLAMLFPAAGAGAPARQSRRSGLSPAPRWRHRADGSPSAGAELQQRRGPERGACARGQGARCLVSRRRHQAALRAGAGSCEAKVGAELARLGLFQSSFHASLIGEAAVTTPAGDLAAIERVADAAALEEFLDAHAAGWKIPIRTASRPTSAAGSISPAGRFIWRASMAGRRRPPSSTSTTRSAIAPMRRPIPPSGAADCKRPCCAGASPTPSRRRRLRLQRRRIPFNQPPQHGARGHARVVRPRPVERRGSDRGVRP